MVWFGKKRVSKGLGGVCEMLYTFCPDYLFRFLRNLPPRLGGLTVSPLFPFVVLHVCSERFRAFLVVLLFGSCVVSARQQTHSGREGKEGASGQRTNVFRFIMVKEKRMNLHTTRNLLVHLQDIPKDHLHDIYMEVQGMTTAV